VTEATTQAAMALVMATRADAKCVTADEKPEKPWAVATKAVGESVTVDCTAKKLWADSIEEQPASGESTPRQMCAKPRTSVSVASVETDGTDPRMCRKFGDSTLAAREDVSPSHGFEDTTKVSRGVRALGRVQACFPQAAVQAVHHSPSESCTATDSSQSEQEQRDAASKENEDLQMRLDSTVAELESYRALDREQRREILRLQELQANEQSQDGQLPQRQSPSSSLVERDQAVAGSDWQIQCSLLKRELGESQESEREVRELLFNLLELEQLRGERNAVSPLERLIVVRKELQLCQVLERDLQEILQTRQKELAEIRSEIATGWSPEKSAWSPSRKLSLSRRRLSLPPPPQLTAQAGFEDKRHTLPMVVPMSPFANISNGTTVVSTPLGGDVTCTHTPTEQMQNREQPTEETKSDNLEVHAPQLEREQAENSGITTSCSDLANGAEKLVHATQLECERAENSGISMSCSELANGDEELVLATRAEYGLQRCSGVAEAVVEDTVEDTDNITPRCEHSTTTQANNNPASGNGSRRFWLPSIQSITIVFLFVKLTVLLALASGNMPWIWHDASTSSLMMVIYTTVFVCAPALALCTGYLQLTPKGINIHE